MVTQNAYGTTWDSIRPRKDREWVHKGRKEGGMQMEKRQEGTTGER